MAASSAAPFFSPPPPLSLILNPKPLYILASHKSISPFHAPILTFPSKTQSSRIRSYNLNFPKTTKCWKLCATNGISTSPVESSQQIVSSSGDGVYNIISALLFIAFIGLSILTVGVIYIAVTDYLQKRERERFEKEEASKKKKKKSGKKGKVRARARGGPRGFGMKIEEDDDDDDAVGAD